MLASSVDERDLRPLQLHRCRIALVAELLAAFFVVPLLIYWRVVPNAPIPFLLLLAAGAAWALRRDPSFDRSRLWNVKDAKKALKPVLFRDAVLIIILGLAVRYFAPDLLFSFVKRAPVFWVVIMFLYPLFSVYPQELLFRAYFFHRYKSLFGDTPLMILASAFTFAFVHIVFHNWVAVVLSFAGGILFSLTYQQSGSLLLACVDHTLFGNFIFTIGLGQYFFHAARR